MKRTSILFLALLFVGLLAVSGAWGAISYSEFPPEVNGLKSENIDELFRKARTTRPWNDPTSIEAQYQLGVFFQYILKAGHGLDLKDKEGLETKKQIVSSSYEQMMYWLKRAAVRGHVQAQFLLGYMSYYGMFLGGACDIDGMHIWLELAAKNGHARAQAHLAYMYMIMRPDKEKAFHWAQNSAEQGDTYGMYLLGRIYNDSSYPEYNPDKAKEWNDKANKADKDDPTIDLNHNDVPTIREKSK